MEKVEKVIRLGSIHEALYSGFVSVKNVLSYLEKNEIKKDNYEDKYRKLTAFKVATLLNAKAARDFLLNLTNNQHNQNNKKKEEKYYVAIYYVLGREKTFKLVEEKPLLKMKEKAMTKMAFNPQFNKLINLVCNVSFNIFLPAKERPKYDHKDFDAMIYARSYDYINKFGLLEEMSCLNCDYLEPLKYSDWELYEEDVVARCESLLNNFPEYWERVAKPLYKDLVTKNMEFLSLDKKTVTFWDKLFPNIFPEKIMKARNVSLMLHSYSTEIKAYILGFPIHEYIPSSQSLEKSIDKLNELNIEEFCKSLGGQKEEGGQKEKYLEGNTQDSFLNNFEEYNRFDVVEYFTDNKGQLYRYRFSRPEFKILLKNGLNPYTREPLPEFLIENINNRNGIAEIYGLPPSATLSDLLQQVENGTLYLDEKVQNKDDDSSDDSSDNLPDDLPELEEVSFNSVSQSESDIIEGRESEEIHEGRERNEGEEREDGEERRNNCTKLRGRVRQPNGQIEEFNIDLPPELIGVNRRNLIDLFSALLQGQGMVFVEELPCDCPNCT